MPKMRFQPHLGDNSASQNPLGGFERYTSKGRGGQGSNWEGKEGGGRG